jgi:predicted alpha/beta-hydrolase family hydrolase
MGKIVFFLAGDSYPADEPWESRLRAGLMDAHSTFVSHRDIHRGVSEPNKPIPVEARLDMLERAVLDLHGGRDIFLVGRSSGARVVSLFTTRFHVKAVVCLGYPFRAAQQVLEPERFAHLASLVTPTLIVQGRDDVYGGIELTEHYQLSESVRVCFVPGGHEQDMHSAAGAYIVRQARDFIDGGWRETGLNFAEFDEPFYLGLYPDVARAVDAGVMESGAFHFRHFGQRERRKFRLLNRREI